MIARADLFGDPVRTGAELSPRGDRIAFLAPRDGVQNIWVMSTETPDQAQPVTADHGSGVRNYAWGEDNQTLLYLQDNQGDENWRLYAVDVASGVSRALTPAGARAEVIGLSPNDATGVVVTLNERDAAWPDVYRYDIKDGTRILLQRNVNTAASRGFTRFVVDHDNHLRLGLRTQPDGAVEVARRTGPSRWSTLFTVAFDDARQFEPLGFEADGRHFLVLDSSGRNYAALVRVDAVTGDKSQPLGESPHADVSDVWLNPATSAPEAYAATYLRREWRAISGTDAQADIDFLSNHLRGEISVSSRSVDDKRWIVVEDDPTTPTRTYLYDRIDPANRRLTRLFVSRPALDHAPLQSMTPLEIQARDGQTLVSYLTLPIGSDSNHDARPDHPAPMVLLVHGGPWSRDSYGFNAVHQWLANRGYAVLSVNFRGSAGFGKAFLNQGNREWGGRMQDDLLDAVQWAVENGIAQPDHIAIAGDSYGGYAALEGLAKTPDRFACGISYNGAVNLATMFDMIPSAFRDELYLRIGDARTPEGRQMLRERSPITNAAQIRRPLLLAQGLRDPRLARAEAEQLANALRWRRNPLVYMVYPDEGRGLTRLQNRLSFFAVAESFLGSCLRGRVEPPGQAFQNSSMQVFDGAGSVPGLSAFARRPAIPASTQETTDTEISTDTLAPVENLAPQSTTQLAPAPQPTATTTSTTPQ